MSGTSLLRLLSDARFKGSDAEAYFCSADKNTAWVRFLFLFFILNMSEKRQGRKYMLIVFLSNVYKK